MAKSYVNVYDFDGTIYDGDSTIDFYKFCLKKYKNMLVDEVYIDSLSDIPIMLLGKKSYLVKRDKITLFEEGNNV